LYNTKDVISFTLLRIFKHRIVLFLLFSLFYFSILPFYYNVFLTFGCFDDCFNYLGGYFMLKDKILFSEVFYNHQPFMAYISYFIQLVTDPAGIYQLVQYHRLFTYALSFVLGSFLILRFGYIGFGFLLFYEPTKYYLFGDRFLAEGIIVYLLVYLLGIVFMGFFKQKPSRGDLFLSVVFTWIVVYMREPYIPLVIILFGTVVFFAPSWRHRLVSSGALIFLSVLPLFFLPFSDYWFNVVYINQVVSLGEQSFSLFSPLIIFIYPLYSLFFSQITFFGSILVWLSLLFVIALFLFSYTSKRYGLVFYLIFILGLSNLRYTEPGLMFYQSFHMLVWYGLFLMALFLLVSQLLRYKTFVRFSLLFLCILGIGIFSPQSFFWETHNKQEDFVTNFGQYVSSGEVVRMLADNESTLFLDGFDDLIYYQSGILSDYKYTWFTSVMPAFDVYMEERDQMFATSPPDFYYGECGYRDDSLRLPSHLTDSYTRFYFADKPTCLHIFKEHIPEISDEQFTSLQNIGFYLQDV